MNIDSLTYVIFGATGNLAQIKILPALCELSKDNLLFGRLNIIAFGRRSWTDNEYCEFVKPLLKKFDDSVIQKFIKKISYVEGAFDDVESFKKLKSKINADKVFYHLAVLPESYKEIIKNLGEEGLTGSILIEKPFGSSLESATDLENFISKYFNEENVFRIDHYLGKIGLKEIINKRINNDAFESKLNNKNVSKIVCKLREVVDIQGRGEFYDTTGAFKDVGQNHGLEIIATLLMELKKDLLKSRAEIINSLEYITGSLIRAQYIGYKNEKGVSRESSTETYFRLCLQSNGDRFQGIKIELEAGKALELIDRKESIAIYYNNGTSVLFDIDIPKHYNAYESVILSALNNDKTLFVSLEEVYGLWKFADQVAREMVKTPLLYYRKGEGSDLVNS